MIYTCHYPSPLGGMTMTGEGETLTGLWFDGQKGQNRIISGIRSRTSLLYRIVDKTHHPSSAYSIIS